MNENMIWLVPDLCGTIVNIKNHSLCSGRLSNKCRHDQCCALFHLTDDQINYVLSDIGSDIYLNSCPGSGKTEVIGVKVAYELSHWQSKTSGIAILTFTNSAEDEIRNRTVSYLRHQIQYPHFLGTFTSWLHGYIANPFLNRIVKKLSEESDSILKIVDSSCESEFLNAFKTNYSYGRLGNIPANHFFYDIKSQKYCYCGDKLSTEKEEFKKQCDQEKKHIKADLKATKKKFRERGFFVYEDIECLVDYLLKTHTNIASLIAKRFPFIIIDECQDLSYVQLSILNELHKYGTQIHLVGDLNQAIYGFRSIEPSDTKNFIMQNHFKEMHLIENFRSNQAIVNVSGRVVNRKSYIVGKKEQTAKTPLVALLYNGGKEEKLIQSYQNLLLQESIQFQDCCIIVRNMALKRKLLGVKWGSWKNALSDSLANAHHKSIGEYHIGKLRNKVKNKKVIATFHQSTNSTQNCNLKIETIHGCKGRGFESVLFVSSAKQSCDSASYWKNWFPQGESETTESTRLAYVAFSRAKQFLAIGIPTPTNSSLDDTDFRLIQNYGFKVYDCSTQSWIEK